MNQQIEEYLTTAMEHFPRDPANTDFQRGYLIAIIELVGNEKGDLAGQVKPQTYPYQMLAAMEAANAAKPWLKRAVIWVEARGINPVLLTAAAAAGLFVGSVIYLANFWGCL